MQRTLFAGLVLVLFGTTAYGQTAATPHHAISTYATTSAMTQDDLKTTVQRFYDALSNAGTVTLDELNSFMATDWHSTPTPMGGGGTEGLLQTLRIFHGLIPDLKWTVHEMLVDGNRVTVRSIATGTPNGDFFGVPTDGSKSFEIMTIDIHTVENGKMTTGFHVEDWAGAIQQLTAQ